MTSSQVLDSRGDTYRLYSKLLQRNPETWYQFPVSAMTPSDTYEAIINPHFARYFKICFKYLCIPRGGEADYIDKVIFKTAAKKP